MSEENPFLHIVASGEEEVIGKDFKEFLDKLKKEIPKLLGKERIIFILGEPGSGKSLIIKKVCQNLKKSKLKLLNFNPKILQDFRDLKDKEVVVVENFHLIEAMKKKDAEEVVRKIIERTEKGNTFILEASRDTLEFLRSINKDLKKYEEVFEVPRLREEDIYEFILSKLKSAHGKKIKSIEPFDKHDIAQIWRKSRGNPRMILLLAQTLYDIKMRKV